MAKITIIGLGLIGGSLGKALRQAGGGFEVVGHDKDGETGARARKKGAIDRAEWNLPRAVEDASLVIVATPAAAIERVFNDVAPYVRPGCVVTDTASTKVDVLDWAKRILPEGVAFVGGDPMVGKAHSGIDEAEAGLFKGGTYCVVPAPNAPDEAVSLVVGLVSAVGARPLFIDPVEHDSYMAAISHLPYLAAAALVKVAANSPAWRDIAKVAAWGFRDTTQLASGDTATHRDICLTNRTPLTHWLDVYIEQLGELRAAVAAGDKESLEQVLGAAKQARDDWETGRDPETASPLSQTTGTSDQLRQMLIGGWGGRQDKRR
ncbi:MAG: prephenate dehydrogenase/arogenate dehydrogenase family protein [Chloroflexi bacterium]|nr:prephenate dehydrogenase/arogenate dehydrogenase family protein [Chloroflexota bacterium]